MRAITTVHRWTGGLVGLLLAVLGLSGTLLLHQDLFIRATVPHAADRTTPDLPRIAAVAHRFLDDPATGARGIRLAGDGIGVHRVFFVDRQAGAYVDQSGRVVERWSSEWRRPEVWLFDLHHHLLAGDTGTTVVGIAGLAGFGFVVTGTLLWWRTRGTFELRALPRRATRTAIVRHHRDLGIVVAPLLLVSFVTGSMMVLKPVEALILAPLGKATHERTGVPARARDTPVDWAPILRRARARFPTAELRWIGAPTPKEPAVLIRMRQPGEWTPNGRTTMRFTTDGRPIALQDGLRRLPFERAADLEYPLHAGIVPSGIALWILTVSGLALTMLGTLATWSFWFRGARPASRTIERTIASDAASRRQDR